MDKFYTGKELAEDSAHKKMVCAKRKSNMNPIHYDDYTNWQTDNEKSYDNFMKLTTQPQNNPYGITGNPEAMKKLELQKPIRQPSRQNPFMNVEITDYNIPQKYGRAKKFCDDNCNKNFYRTLQQSPSDALWKREASERQFYTMPNSSNPSEQKKFAEWLYGNNFVGKTGSIYNRYGYPYTPDSLINNGFNAAAPENAGQVDNNFGVPVTQPNASPFVNNPNYGYGFGGIPGGIPYHNIMFAPPSMQLMPMPLFPSFPQQMIQQQQPSQTVPAGLLSNR